MTTLIKFTNEVYNFLGITHLSLVVKIVTLFFIAFLLAIFILSVFTLLLLIYHQIENSFRKKYHTIYTNKLIAYSLDQTLPIPIAPRFHMKYLRDSLLDLLFVTKGFERSLLLEIYNHNGLWSKDIRRLKHPLWNKRLAALVRLDLWQISLRREFIQSLLNDKNKQIRQIALKNFSRTLNESEAELLLTKLLDKGIFHSTTHESIHRLFQNHPRVVINALEREEFIPLWPFILKSMGSIKSIESVPTLLEVVKKSNRFGLSDEILEKAITALGKIGDPRAIGVLKEAIESFSPNVRLSALRSLFKIDPSEINHYRDSLINDPDPSIRNWMMFYLRGGHD